MPIFISSPICSSFLKSLRLPIIEISWLKLFLIDFIISKCLSYSTLNINGWYNSANFHKYWQFCLLLLYVAWEEGLLIFSENILVIKDSQWIYAKSILVIYEEGNCYLVTLVTLNKIAMKRAWNYWARFLGWNIDYLVFSPLVIK